MRKTSFLFASAAMALALMPVAAQQTGPAGQGAKTKQVEPNTADFDKQLAQMQENMNKMQEQMNRIRQAQDPQERQRLLEEHWTTMQNSMALMHGIRGPGMMDGPGMGRGMMGWGHMRNYYQKLTPEQLKQRQYMTDQQLRLHQMMMDEMMQHNYWMGQGQAAPTSK